MTRPFIFDFDGTLVNSENAIYQSFYEITKELAPDRIEFVKKIIIGPPLHETAKEILGNDKLNLIDTFIKRFIAIHDNEVVLYSTPYINVIKTLKQLHKKKIPMAIATNKRKEPTIKLINHFKWNKYFKVIECSNCNNVIRNKSEIIKQLIIDYPLFNDAFFVGDTLGDGKASNDNHIDFIKVNYGYGQNQNWKKIKIFKEINCINEILNL